MTQPFASARSILKLGVAALVAAVLTGCVTDDGYYGGRPYVGVGLGVGVYDYGHHRHHHRRDYCGYGTYRYGYRC